MVMKMMACRLFLLCFSLLTRSTHGFRFLRSCPTVTSSATRLDSSSTSTRSEQQGERVGIVGAGAIALGTAALLHDAHHKPMLWSPSGRALEPLFTRTGAGAGAGAVSETATFSCRIAKSAQELAEQNRILLLALPANGHKQVLDALAPFLKENHHHVIISSHASMGALYLARLCQAHHQEIPITAWGTTVVTARQPNPQTVRINTIRKSVDYCTIAGTNHNHDDHRDDVCKLLFPTIAFSHRPGLLAITLSNLNPQNHLGIALGNISRMDLKQEWYQSQNITPRIGQFLQDLDRERLEIAHALGFQVKTIFEHFSWSFHVPIQDSISDMCQEIYKAGNDVLGPNTAESRYVTEDVPFGLPMIVVLGELVGRPAKLHKAGLDILSSMYGRDFQAENDLLASLQLEQYTLEELQQAALTGRLPAQPRIRRDEQPQSQPSALPQHQTA